MRAHSQRIYSAAIVVVALLVTSYAFAAKPQTFTGTVGDAVCGAKHTMDGDDEYCLRTCIRRGSKYDLVVGDKVYVLEPKDQTILDTLDKLGNQQAKVTGEANGDTIAVESVTAAQ